MAGLATRQSGYKAASFLQHHAAFWGQGGGRLSGESVPYFFIPFVSRMTLPLQILQATRRGALGMYLPRVQVACSLSSQ